MNFIFIRRSEAIAVGDLEFEAKVEGSRCDRLKKDHQLEPQILASCVLQDVGVGKALIKEINTDYIKLEIKITETPKPVVPIDLVVAFARPQTLKKILQLSASFGLRSLSFLKTARVVPSYLQSRVLFDSEIEDNFILGCQQSGEPGFPEFKKFFSLQALLDEVKGRSELYFGDLQALPTPVVKAANSLLLIGPELGLLPEEKNLLEECGFSGLSLGSRAQRVELATAALVGRLL